jgi:hypothetical protein
VELEHGLGTSVTQ